LTDVSEVLTASVIKAIIALMMEAVSASETLVNFCGRTRHNNPKDSHVYTRRRENLKSYFYFRKDS
jgi:hypothetical protein